MAFIIGTAGHIDHGKTSLIKTLTGQDTDRLKEEQARGISIDLGFAYLELPDGERAGIVDVPGHERFIRNMLAGAHGIDLVLFTVAADDGVMPQTEEHLDIVHLLGVPRAIFIITKVDLVSADRRRDVAEEIEILVAGTTLEGSPVLPFSATTQEGLEAIRARIVETLGTLTAAEDAAYFRLPVDRVFVLQGHGVVVTGTALSGQVRAGDRLRGLPGDQMFRVRSVQVHGEPVEVARRGQRTALNLTGVDRASLTRGDVISHEKLTLTSDRFDAYLEVRPSARKGLTSHQRVRVHVGTAERLAKVIVIGPNETVGPKQHTYCQIVLTEPLLVLRGDHFIVRDETAQKTLGGGVVVRPRAPRHRRSDPGVEGRLSTLHRGSTDEAIARFLDDSSEFAVPLPTMYQFLNVDEDQARDTLSRSEGVHAFTFDGETLYTTKAQMAHLESRLLATLELFHRTHPLAPGMDLEEARAAVSNPTGGALDERPERPASGPRRQTPQVAPRVFRAFVEALGEKGVITREGNVLRRPDHTVTLDGAEAALRTQILELLSRTPFTPPDVKEIEHDTGAPHAQLGDVIRVMEREGSIVRVTTELYFRADALDTLRQRLTDRWADRDITPAEFREEFGTSRKFAIPLLEHLDREGITIRQGDRRRLRTSVKVGS